MKFTFCHLSDIHFKNSNNYISEKKDAICDAILEDCLKNELIIFLVTGDIAQSCQSEEYEIALDFFVTIQEKLKSSKNISTVYFFAPGNHDCDFSDSNINMDDDIRRDRIIQQRDNMTKTEFDYLSQQLCVKQNNFNDFSETFKIDNLNSLNVSVIYETIWLKKFKLALNTDLIYLNILNTAWLTRYHEVVGELFIPENQYTQIKREDGLNITMYHHPSNWMNPNERIAFNKWVLNKSDIVLVGHEHVGRNENIQTRESQYNAQYGEVLQEWGEPSVSGFIINIVDEANFIAKIYKWNDLEKIYIKENEIDKDFCNTQIRYLYYTKDYQNYINTFDMHVNNPNRRDIFLKDLYIYPDIEVFKENANIYRQTKDIITIKGEELKTYILEQKHISISGGSKSGKTALAKMLSYDYIKNDIYPLIINCDKLSSTSNKSLMEIERSNITNEYGREALSHYRQLPIKKKMLILDNFEKCGRNKEEILKYFDNFYEYIITLSNNLYEIEILGDTLSDENSKYIQSSICELGPKKRNSLIKKWFMKEDDIIINENDINKKIEVAQQTIDVLKGNGYMPCIPSYILIILQQLEYTTETTQDKSSYGYLYEFLIMRAILEMNQSSKYVNKDIASGILIEVASFMLDHKDNTISKEDFEKLITKYNRMYYTDANTELYLDKYCEVELLENNDGLISYKYPYIHYYYTAKYMANNIQNPNVEIIIKEMSQTLYDERCGDIMIFLCHLTKNIFVINSVLENAKNLLLNKEIFDFTKHKSINLEISEFIDSNLIPEKELEKRQDHVLDIKEKREQDLKKQGDKSTCSLNKTQPNIDGEMIDLSNALKTIDVLGQILKNYPGTIVGTIKEDILTNIHNLGMRTITFVRNMLYNKIEVAYTEIEKKLKDNKGVIEDERLEELFNTLKSQAALVNKLLDNTFGILTYCMIRRLAAAISNEALISLLSGSRLNGILSFDLIKNATYLNEFGILNSSNIIKEYDELKNNSNIFSANLLRLMVYDHYYTFGSKDYKTSQLIWEKLGFDKKARAVTIFQGKS